MINSLPINFYVANQLKQQSLAKKYQAEETSSKKDIEIIRNKLSNYFKK